VGKANPKKFGYNGIKGGMSGVSFVVGWVYANAGDAERLMKGPYDPETKKGWETALSALAAFNKDAVLTRGTPARSTCSIAARSRWVRSGSTCSTPGRPKGRSRRPSS